jgi:FkbM family methyltransferase
MDEWHVKQLNTLSKLIQPNWHFADVGVARGEMTDLLLPLMDKGHLFEADPFSYSQLEKKYASFDKLTLNNNAVYSEEGFVDFSVNGEFIGGISKHTQHESGNNVKVKTITLDKYFKDRKINLIKIDVEGAEFEVLKGAKQLMNSQSPVFQVEFHWDEDWTDENLEFIKKSDYYIYDLNLEKINLKNRPYQAILAKGEL